MESHVIARLAVDDGAPLAAFEEIVSTVSVAVEHTGLHLERGRDWAHWQGAAEADVLRAHVGRDVVVLTSQGAIETRIEAAVIDAVTRLDRADDAPSTG